MQTLSATDLAIAIALSENSLTVTEQSGRFGPFWAIADSFGLIEVALSEQEAQGRVAHVEELAQ